MTSGQHRIAQSSAYGTGKRVGVVARRHGRTAAVHADHPAPHLAVQHEHPARADHQVIDVAPDRPVQVVRDVPAQALQPPQRLLRAALTLRASRPALNVRRNGVDGGSRQTFTTMEAQRVLSRLGFTCRRVGSTPAGREIWVRQDDELTAEPRPKDELLALKAALGTVQAAVAGLHERVAALEARMLAKS